jgi:hypothetical protein
LRCVTLVDTVEVCSLLNTVTIVCDPLHHRISSHHTRCTCTCTCTYPPTCEHCMVPPFNLAYSNRPSQKTMCRISGGRTCTQIVVPSPSTAQAMGAVRLCVDLVNVIFAACTRARAHTHTCIFGILTQTHTHIWHALIHTHARSPNAHHRRNASLGSRPSEKRRPLANQNTSSWSDTERVMGTSMRTNTCERHCHRQTPTHTPPDPPSAYGTHPPP